MIPEPMRPPVSRMGADAVAIATSAAARQSRCRPDNAIARRRTSSRHFARLRTEVCPDSSSAPGVDAPSAAAIPVRRITFGKKRPFLTHRIARYGADECVSAGDLGVWQ